MTTRPATHRCCRNVGTYKATRSQVLLGVMASLAISLSACRSDHIEITVQNHTGEAIHLLEVDYPSASFGTQQLASGASYHYRIQVQGSGPVTVTYSTPSNVQPHITGPSLADRQQGTLEIDLLPNGKAVFHPQVQTN